LPGSARLICGAQGSHSENDKNPAQISTRWNQKENPMNRADVAKILCGRPVYRPVVRLKGKKVPAWMSELRYDVPISPGERFYMVDDTTMRRVRTGSQFRMYVAEVAFEGYVQVN
jgi:hypothetical protein